MSNWIAKAKTRWPRSARAREIHGDGQFAVLTCAYQHPSAERWMPAGIHLFATREAAEQFKAALDRDVCGIDCHAVTKGLCWHNHELIDLGEAVNG